MLLSEITNKELLLRVQLQDCPSYEVAHQIASTLSTSMLLKCAINGADANWGRILCAVGYSNPKGFVVDPTTVSVSFVDQTPGDTHGKEMVLLTNGEPSDHVDEAWARKVLEQEQINIIVRMGQGREQAT